MHQYLAISPKEKLGPHLVLSNELDMIAIQLIHSINTFDDPNDLIISNECYTSFYFLDMIPIQLGKSRQPAVKFVGGVTVCSALRGENYSRVTAAVPIFIEPIDGTTRLAMSKRSENGRIILGQPT